MPSLEPAYAHAYKYIRIIRTRVSSHARTYLSFPYVVNEYYYTAQIKNTRNYYQDLLVKINGILVVFQTAVPTAEHTECA